MLLWKPLHDQSGPKFLPKEYDGTSNPKQRFCMSTWSSDVSAIHHHLSPSGREPCAPSEDEVEAPTVSKETLKDWILRWGLVTHFEVSSNKCGWSALSRFILTALLSGILVKENVPAKVIFIKLMILLNLCETVLEKIYVSLQQLVYH